MSSGERRFVFEGFVYDPATGELSGPAGASRLPPKPARLLTLLLERRGALVAREELQRELWPAQHVELDQALAYTVRQVRAALGDEAGEPRFVETLPRRGYRFIGRLDHAAEAAGPRERPDGSRPRTAPGSGRRRRAVAISLLALAVAAVVAWAAWPPRRVVREVPGPGPVRLALLPLEDAGAVNERLTEELLVALTARPGLEVVGPATTAVHRGSGLPHTELGRALGVDFMVSGGYRPGEQVLFLQLVRVSDGGHLFARRYPGSEEEVRERLPEAAAAISAAAVPLEESRAGEGAAAAAGVAYSG